MPARSTVERVRALALELSETSSSLVERQGARRLRDGELEGV